MLITRTITKKILENLIHDTFSNFGSLSSSSLLDSLKLLGFYYATNAGISINIEDLKTPDVKEQFIETANNTVNSISKDWQQGFVSDIERFQTIIDSWNSATEGLKNRVIDYYRNFDPANNLYIMAFSGARGNMSQVRQLIGMRGLMSDQEGKIIDLPIQANFREGLSSIDYIISSYGARKGIVDTALKTADSGYLTRRLIYIAQDLIIREIDCKTQNGVVVLLNEKVSIKNITGRILISTNKTSETTVNFLGNVLTTQKLNYLKKYSPITLNIRSSLTCNSNGSICQKCYGWDLAQNQIISLGEAVGIIAAQSIGEPGTQLTMRTFHTGGIFTSETLKQIVAPFTGKIFIPVSLKTVPYRTTHGIIVEKVQQEITIKIVNWKGISQEIFLDIGSFLYVNKSSFIKKGQLICESSTQSVIRGPRKLKPLYTSLSGEVRLENLLVRKISRQKKVQTKITKSYTAEIDITKPTIKVNENPGIMWLAAGKIFSLPQEIKYRFPKYLNKENSFGTLILATPYCGIINFENGKVILTDGKNRKIISTSFLNKVFQNYTVKFTFLVKNYQYVDAHTKIGRLDFFPYQEGKIYSMRQKAAKFIKTLFLITEADIWKIHTTEKTNKYYSLKPKGIIKAGDQLTKTKKATRSGFFIQKDGLKWIFQTAIPTFLSPGSILNYKQGDFIFQKQIFATLVNYTQQTEDIVQGLPKIEELIEARRPKIKAYLSLKPGIFFYSSNSENTLITQNLEKDILKCNYIKNDEDIVGIKKSEKQEVQIIHSVFFNDQIVSFNNQIFKILPIPYGFVPLERYKTKRNHYSFYNEKLEKYLVMNDKKATSIWHFLEETLDDYCIYKYNNQTNQIDSQNYLVPLHKQSVCRNKNDDYIIEIEENKFVYLINLNPSLKYKFPEISKIITKNGSFVDIGEPLTDGMIDIHELLQILFNYHVDLDGTMLGTMKSLTKFQLLLVNSIQAIYQSQGVMISSKHIEIIVRQMTAKVLIKESGDTPFLAGELIRLSLINEIYKSIYQNISFKKMRTPKYEPLLLSTTNSSLGKDGFLSAAGFQETKRVLTKAALENSCDWLRGLKECVIIGRLIPAGSAFLNYKNYLDNIYLFKN